MKKLFMVWVALAGLLMACPQVFARADTVEVFTQAVMTGDVPVLEKVLAPNFWYIGANGHIRDKEHFIQEIRNKELVVNRITLTNNRETQLGTTRLITANGTFKGHYTTELPNGLMRYTLVVADNKGQEQVALFQATPVIATPECKDGNCKIK